jgi:hypothetical protein
MDGNSIMRKLIIIALVAAIGAVAMIQHASAQHSPFCLDMQGQPCDKGNQNPPNPPPPQPPGPWHQPPGGNGSWNHHHPHQDGGPNIGIFLGLGSGEVPYPPTYGGGYYLGQCRNIAFDLRDQGFERVRPIRCTGPRLVFSAWRDGDKLILYVNRWGRILRIIPAS